MAARIGRTVADSTPDWPEPPKPPKGAPNILVVLFDDVGFSDFGCYGSPIQTPTIDAIAARGLRYAGFHTTAMCSTTRAALLTGRNHHSVGVGCLANFDSGYPGYRGKIAREAGTLAEMLRAHAYRNYMIGKWHVTPLTESGATGPFDGWPLGRGFDRFYGFLDAETDQYAPELVSDNTHIHPPGTYADGYHLTADLVDQAIRFIGDHIADRPDLPWLTWLALGACHAPHQAPGDLIRSYDTAFAHGWAMASNTPLRRYKQNTHGGGIRDPFIMSWPQRIRARGELRHQFVHACDLVPTLLELIGMDAPATIAGCPQMPIEGESFAGSITDASAPSKSSPQYFEMFGHRGLWQAGWKAVAFHPPGTPFENDKWELFHLERDFSEVDDLAAEEPDRLAAMIKLWWSEAEKHQVLPLDDRFGARFAENAARFHGARSQFTFHAGMGHVPTDVAPDVRSRSYTIEAHVEIDEAGAEGVLIAHGDATSGYSLYVKEGRLVHDLNIGGGHEIVTSDRSIAPGARRLGVRVERLRRESEPAKGARTGFSQYTLLIDGEPAGSMTTQLAFNTLISWSGLDIGRDRGSPVSLYAEPFQFTGTLSRVTVVMHDDQKLDGEGIGRAAMARQ